MATRTLAELAPLYPTPNPQIEAALLATSTPDKLSRKGAQVDSLRVLTMDRPAARTLATAEEPLPTPSAPEPPPTPAASSGSLAPGSEATFGGQVTPTGVMIRVVADERVVLRCASRVRNCAVEP